MRHYCPHGTPSPLALLSLSEELGYFVYLIGERAKRARLYLVRSMEARDIYIYIFIRTSVSNTHARVSVLR